MSWQRVLNCCFVAILLLSTCKEKTRPVNIPSEIDANTRAENLPLPPAPNTIIKKNLISLPTWPMHRLHGASHFAPFDEATKDPSLVKFRARLWKAVQDKDVKYITSILDDKVQIGFDGENGKQAFIKNWQLYSNPKGSTLWQALGDVLKLGGAFGKNSNYEFCAPYLFFTVDDFEDPFTQGVITGEGVRIRAEANSTSKVIANISWEKVNLMYQDRAKEETIDGESYSWKKIQLADGQEGFVYGKFLRVPVDYRIWLKKTNEQWKIQSFLAGD